MPVSEQIKPVKVEGDFHRCPVCSYDKGFHTSLVRGAKTARIVLICPECLSRFDVGWETTLREV